MSTLTTHQQSLADAGSETRPPMLERGSYIPWASRFIRYLNRKRENRKWLNKEIDEGPYVFKDFTHPDSQTPRPQTEDDLTGDDLKHYEAEIEAMNLILISIPNDIYNSVDAFNGETHFNNEFDQFVAEPGEVLVSVYNQDNYDDLFYYLHQYEKLVNTSKANKLEKSHDPPALVAHTGSSSRISSPYYVTHHSLVVDYDDDYQGDAFQNNYEDPLTSAMMLLALAITQRFSNPTNNQIQDVHMFKRKSLRITMYRIMLGIHRELFKLHLQDMLQMFNATIAVRKDEAGVTLTAEQNDFIVADATRMEEIEELSANICLMAKIQPANIDFDAWPSYDSTFLSEVQQPSTSYVNPLFAEDNQEQKYPKQPKIINDTIGDDQIDSNIIFDEPNVDVNSGRVEYDNNVQASYELEQLARNSYKEAEKQQKISNKDFVPQKELSAKQKYFSSTFTPSENPLNARTSTSPSETKALLASMPSSNPMKLYLEKMENEFQTLFALLQTNSKREIIFYTTPEEILLTKFCQQEVKPILYKLQLNFEIFQKRFSEVIKDMKDVFESIENYLSATWKQNEILNDQLLETKLKHEIECCMLLSHECVNNNVQDEIEKIQRDSIEIQEGMQKRINILENDVQRYVRAKNQDLLITISELKTKLKNVEKGAASSVRRPLNGDSPFMNSLLSNTKKSSEKVEVSVRTNKKTNVASKNVVSNKKIVTDVDVKNALKAKDVLCVSCAKNVLIPCLDKCLVNYKLNVHSKVRRALFTTPRTAKSTFVDTTPVVSKTRFSVKTTQSKFLDTTPVVSKTKIAAVTHLSAKNKVSSAFKSISVILRESSFRKYMKNKIRTSRMWQKWYELESNVGWSPIKMTLNVVVQIILWIVDSGCSKHMTGDHSLLENFVEKFKGTACFGNDHFAAITGYGDYVQGNITICHVYYVEDLGHNLFSVGQFYDGDLEVVFCSKTCYVRNLEADDLPTGARESNLYTISISDMVASSFVCLMSKATSTKSWL
ncbi:hypothetical protein Tco_1145558 [Tanacetum coccineum]